MWSVRRARKSPCHYDGQDEQEALKKMWCARLDSNQHSLDGN
jgi:hypothetical protein